MAGTHTSKCGCRYGLALAPHGAPHRPLQRVEDGPCCDVSGRKCRPHWPVVCASRFTLSVAIADKNTTVNLTSRLNWQRSEAPIPTSRLEDPVTRVREASPSSLKAALHDATSWDKRCLAAALPHPKKTDAQLTRRKATLLVQLCTGTGPYFGLIQQRVAGRGRMKYRYCAAHSCAPSVVPSSTICAFL